MSLNTVKVPTLQQLGEVAEQLGLAFIDADLAAHHESLLPAIEAYNRLDQVTDELPPVTYPRLPGRRPTPEENRHGASTMEGYVPDINATVVTRILNDVGTIAGKTVCEYFCFSGSSHTSASGPVHNPHRVGYSAAVRPRAVLPSSLRARCRWHWAAIRAARSVSRPRSAGFMD